MVARVASLIEKTPWSQIKNACQHDLYYQTIALLPTGELKGKPTVTMINGGES
jgi:hypothetical protein